MDPHQLRAMARTNPRLANNLAQRMGFGRMQDTPRGMPVVARPPTQMPVNPSPQAQPPRQSLLPADPYALDQAQAQAQLGLMGQADLNAARQAQQFSGMQAPQARQPDFNEASAAAKQFFDAQLAQARQPYMSPNPPPVDFGSPIAAQPQVSMPPPPIGGLDTLYNPVTNPIAGPMPAPYGGKSVGVTSAPMYNSDSPMPMMQPASTGMTRGIGSLPFGSNMSRRR